MVKFSLNEMVNVLGPRGGFICRGIVKSVPNLERGLSGGYAVRLLSGSGQTIRIVPEDRLSSRK